MDSSWLSGGGAAASGLGAIFDMATYGQRRQDALDESARNQRNIEADRKFQREQFTYMQQQNDLMHSREDTAMQRRVEDMVAAGINPVMAAGGSAAAANPSVSAGGPSGAGTPVVANAQMSMMAGITNAVTSLADTISKIELRNSQKLNVDDLISDRVFRQEITSRQISLQEIMTSAGINIAWANFWKDEKQFRVLGERFDKQLAEYARGHSLQFSAETARNTRELAAIAVQEKIAEIARNKNANELLTAMNRQDMEKIAMDVLNELREAQKDNTEASAAIRQFIADHQGAEYVKSWIKDIGFGFVDRIIKLLPRFGH